MTDPNTAVLVRSIQVLEDWIKGDPERERWFDVAYEEHPEKPFIVYVQASTCEVVRGHSVADALAQAAQVVLLNPELAP